MNIKGRNYSIIAAAAMVAAANFTVSAAADSITLTPSKDNTLIQSASGNRSNGSGGAIFSGRVGPSAGGTIRRAVMAFDFSSIPSGSTITSATLTLLLTGTSAPAQTHTLHRLLANWGEGGSSSETGEGAPSQLNDATWIHRYYSSTFWTTAGGDFVASPSATTIIGADLIYYDISSPGMVADIQMWLDSPSTNFGWLMKGNEAIVQTVKKFTSRDVEDYFSRPRLLIHYTPPQPCLTDVTNDGSTGVPDLLAVINAWGACDGACPPYCYGDIVPDCSVGVPDLLAIINNWGDCP